MKLVSLLLAAVAKAYPNDAAKPGLVLSDLGGFYRTRWYASIVRYPVSAQQKEVVKTSHSQSLNAAIRKLALQWTHTDTDEGRALAEALQ